MPNRYEREIEEILRNLEHTEPKAIRGQRSSARTQRGPSPKPRVRQRSNFSLSFSVTDWLLMIAVVAALIAGGYAFTLQSAGPWGLLTPILVAISLVCLILVALSYYLFRPRGPHSPRGVRFGEKTTVTPLRRGFFSDLKTRWHLFVLKLRYNRRNDP